MTVSKEQFDRLVATAPPGVIDPRVEMEGVLENVLGSMLGSMEAHLKKPEKRKRPKPASYAKILLDDLAARGWTLKAKGADQ